MSKSQARMMAEKLVDIYLDHVMSADSDAGWHNGSIIGRLVDFRGDLPQSSGFYGVDRMEKEVRFLRRPHKDLPTAISAIERLTPELKIAVFSDRAYRNRTKVAIDPFHPDKPIEITWTDDAIASELGVSVRKYRDSITEGYRRIADFCGYQEAA